MHPEWILKQISAKAEVVEYLISQERHENGGYHIHAYFKFSKKLDTKDERFFDLQYYRKRYHPNIQKPKHRNKLFRYIKKDKKFISNFETRPIWEQLIQDSTTDKEFLENILYTVNRIDNYSGYRTLRDLWDLKKYESSQEDLKDLSKTTVKDYMNKIKGIAEEK